MFFKTLVYGPALLRAAWRTIRMLKKSIHGFFNYVLAEWNSAKPHKLLDFSSLAIWQSIRGLPGHPPAGWVGAFFNTLPSLFFVFVAPPGARASWFHAVLRRGLSPVAAPYPTPFTAFGV